MVFKLWERFRLPPLPRNPGICYRHLRSHTRTPPLAFGKERPKPSAQRWVYWGATGLVKGPQEPVGAVGVTRKGSRRCGRRGIREPPYRRERPPRPAAGAPRLPAGSRKPWQLVTKSLPGLRCPGCGTREPAQLLELSASRAMSPGSRQWGAAAEALVRVWEAGTSFLAARRTRGAGASALLAAPAGRAASRRFPGGAWPSVAGERSSAPAAKPGASLQDSESTGALPRGVLKLRMKLGTPDGFCF